MPTERAAMTRHLTTFATLLALITVTYYSSLWADQTAVLFEIPDRPNPLASPLATPGGTITLSGIQPKSFNGYLDNFRSTQEVFDLLYESLLSSDPLTADFTPGLAKSWHVSADKKTFTFHIDPTAIWSDGQPVTANDVLWTFNAIMDPANETGPHKVALGVFTPPEVIDPHTIRFTARQAHWRNLMAAGGFAILPSHIFRDKDFNTINFEFPVVSGPYHFAEMRENSSLRLERRPDWWGRTRKANHHIFNFQTINYRFFNDQDNAFEAMKKGDIDLYAVYTARIWANELRGPRFDNNWIIKRRIRNHSPIGFQGFAMNMRRPPFDDLRVRKALAHLLDRETLNSTLMFNAYFLHRSYYEDLYDSQTTCTNTLLNFNPNLAASLLADAGWLPNPKTGLLEKSGRNLTINFLTRDASTDRFLAIYSEALKKVGITLVINRKDFAAWMRDMDAFNFDMTWCSYGGGIFRDPEYMWHSTEADRPAGNNITGFKNKNVDAWIEEQKQEFDIQKRNTILRHIDSTLAATIPYILLWNIDTTRLLYWDKFGMPDTVLSKYGGEGSAIVYWWYDPDSAADLKEAINDNLPLPARPLEVNFDQLFTTPHRLPKTR
ncbi:MAG: ABC transporter substrate-binding protein [Lentisphaerae bacterium]|jgi:microcin C transport system substrate-binding protein|nr:ABC transporter substrate-binding protein [Lentisphaerota bacterium]